MLICQKCQERYDEPYQFCPLDAYKLDEIDPVGNLQVNDTIARYRVLARVQESPTEIVYRAEDPLSNKDVFLWVFDPSLLSPSGAYEQLKKESLLSKTIVHENIAAQYEICSADGRHLLVTEALDGISLARLMMKERWLSPKRAIHLARQIGRACHAAHKQGVYHGGFNPRHLFVSINDQGRELLKVCSFGFAKLINNYKLALLGKGDPSKVSPYEVAYVSPEHARGRSQNIKDESDEEVYSLGVILYEMLAGELPFQAETAPAMLEAHRRVEPAPIKDHNPDFILYSLLDAAVLKALAKDRHKRYGSIEEFLSELDELYQEVDEPKSAIKFDVSVEFAIKRRPEPVPVVYQPESAPQPAAPADQPPLAPAGVRVYETPTPSGVRVFKAPPANAVAACETSPAMGVRVLQTPSLDGVHAFQASSPSAVRVYEAPPPAGVRASEPRPVRSRRSPLVYTALAVVLVLSSGVMGHFWQRMSSRSSASQAVSALSPQPTSPHVVEPPTPVVNVSSSYIKPTSNTADVTPIARAGSPRTVESPAPVANASLPAEAAGHVTYPRRSAPSESIRPALKSPTPAVKANALPAKPADNAAYTRHNAQLGSHSKALRAALDNWIAATNARDLKKLKTLYMPKVSAFYLTRNVSRTTVLTEKARLFRQAKNIKTHAREPQITFNNDGRTATMRFRKPYVIKGKKGSRQGEVLQELRWVKTKAGWRISSERALKVMR